MKYENILRYLEEVQESVQKNPGSLADYDLRQIANLYEIAKSKNVKEVGKWELLLARGKEGFASKMASVPSIERETAESAAWVAVPPPMPSPIQIGRAELRTLPVKKRPGFFDSMRRLIGAGSKDESEKFDQDPRGSGSVAQNFPAKEEKSDSDRLEAPECGEVPASEAVRSDDATTGAAPMADEAEMHPVWNIEDDPDAKDPDGMMTQMEMITGNILAEILRRRGLAEDVLSINDIRHVN